MRPLGSDDPRQVGPYRILGVLGGGGMGRVYLGSSPGGRTVAVKTVRAEFADDPLFRTRFAREVAAAQRVRGPFVAPVLDAEPEAEAPWMATDYVPGVSLAEVVGGVDDEPLPERSARLLVAGLAEALRSIHRHDLVHRDLKPSNVLLTADGPRVIDFGIARSAAHAGLTTTGTVLGTAGFMAPEQVVSDGPEVSGAADVFALGGVLVYAVSGAGPFGVAEPQVLLYRAVHETPHLDEVPPGLRDLARGCLAKDPAQRPDPAAVVAAAGPAGPWEGWLPPAVTERLLRLSARILRAEDERGAPAPTAPAPSPTTPDRAPAPAHPSPAGPAASAPPRTPPPGAFGPPPAALPPAGGVAPGAVPPRISPSPAPPRRPGRRALVGLAAAGVVGAGVGLVRALDRLGGDGTPGAGAPSGSPSAGTPPGRVSPGPSSSKGRSLLPARVRKAGVLVVGTDTSYPPMAFQDASHRAAGVDVDLASALAAELGLQVRLESDAFVSLLPNLASERWDVVMSALVDTREARRGGDGSGTEVGVDFVDYFRTGVSVLVRKGNPQRVGGADDLCGRRVALLNAPRAKDALRIQNNGCGPQIREEYLLSNEEGMDRLRSGAADAYLCDHPFAVHAAATENDGRDFEVVGVPVSRSLLGIAVRREDDGLRDALAWALDRTIANGAYQTVLQRWGVPRCAVSKAEVNAGV